MTKFNEMYKNYKKFIKVCKGADDRKLFTAEIRRFNIFTV